MYYINPDIKKAETLPSSFYNDQVNFATNTKRLLESSWQLVTDTAVFGANKVYPLEYAPGFIDEPLLLIKEDTNYRCISNVCTHRGNILIEKPRSSGPLVCGYHGRKFNLQGKVEFMPEFEKVEGYPRDCDHLTQVDISQWHQFLFVNLKKKLVFDSIRQALDERVGFLDIASFKRSENLCKEYSVKAHWALYCDNYLEGFHIPFVHPGLNQAVEYGSYETVLYEQCNVQIGYAKEGVATFDLPANHIDYGKKVAAYYFWIFPNLMLNFYPWGLSVNKIQPISHNRTKVTFISYVGNEDLIDDSAGAALDSVEMEDEAVVESVQIGMKSSFYNTGRFSPTREQGVHQFHQLIAKSLLD